MSEVVRISKKLDRILSEDSIDEESVLKYLQKLKKLEVTLDMLTSTRVGIMINRLRKSCTDPQIGALGKSLIKQWKKLVPERTDGSTGPTASPDGNTNDTTASDEGPVEAKRSRRSPPQENGSSGSPEEPQTHSVGKGFFTSSSHTTTDPCRLKAREMLQKAFECSSIPDGAFDTEFLAIRVESAIYDVFHDVDSKYKQRVRTRVMNLRDSQNPNLRINILLGHVSPERLAVMTSEVQTRSADEPMTTFVLCNHCGHRWKFC